MKSFWTGLGVQVVPCSEVILEFHLKFAMLWATLSQKGIGQVAFFGVYTDGCLLLLGTFTEIQRVRLLHNIIQERFRLTRHTNLFRKIKLCVEPLYHCGLDIDP